MGMFGSRSRVLLGCFMFILSLGQSLAAFSDQFTAVWTPAHIVPDDATNEVKLILNQDAGAQFASINSFLYGSFSAKMKLIPGNSAGTACTLYLTSYDDNHDEIDIEFLGNETGQPYVLQTNLFTNGVGGREQRTYLWFDPTTDFHNYSVIWNHQQITWLVDDTPIRIYKNIENELPNSYLKSQPMVLAASVFDASSWATRGGAVPTNWANAPFEVNYKDTSLEACAVLNNDVSACTSNYEGNWWESVDKQSLSSAQVTQLRNVQHMYMIYDYCTDPTRYPTPPTECAHNTP
ncbi:hypothetical protein R1sor_010636 [Riccia sorocarpa]|uniref:Xyloglucan endotransglucosylase/hydrolase n=1 Tax=Riccia sorocarpa TaxID=122646 RepID=A0ABD3I2G7_9MARC